MHARRVCDIVGVAGSIVSCKKHTVSGFGRAESYCVFDKKGLISAVVMHICLVAGNLGHFHAHAKTAALPSAHVIASLCLYATAYL